MVIFNSLLLVFEEIYGMDEYSRSRCNLTFWPNENPARDFHKFLAKRKFLSKMLRGQTFDIVQQDSTSILVRFDSFFQSCEGDKLENKESSGFGL